MLRRTIATCPGLGLIVIVIQVQTTQSQTEKQLFFFFAVCSILLMGVQTSAAFAMQ